MRLVGELELAHEHVNAGGKFGGLDTPDFLAMNPHGRVPVIQDVDAIVWESHAILRYFAARYAPDNSGPAIRLRGARIDGWMDWSQTFLQFVGWAKARSAVPTIRQIAAPAACCG